MATAFIWQMLLLCLYGIESRLVVHRQANEQKWNLRHALKSKQKADTEELATLLESTGGIPPVDGAVSQSPLNYFIYDLDPPNYGERFSTRKRYATIAFHFIKALEAKGKKWVLVLAPFVDSFDGTRAYHPWRYLFDISELSKYHNGIMDFDEFIKQNAGKPVHFGDFQEMSNPCDIVEKGFAPYKLDAGATTMKAMGQTVNINKVPVCADGRNVIEKLNEAVGGAGGAVFLSHFFHHMLATEKESQKDDWELRKHWAFAKVILDEAARFKRFVCMHFHSLLNLHTSCQYVPTLVTSGVRSHTWGHT
jgi:hypothetical protein